MIFNSLVMHMTKDEIRDMHFYENMISKLIDAENDSYKKYLRLKKLLIYSIIERVAKYNEKNITQRVSAMDGSGA